MKEESYQLLIDKALRFLSFRSRSKYEVATKLKQFAIKKGISEKKKLDTLVKAIPFLEEVK